jgi:hypothetical protein
VNDRWRQPVPVGIGEKRGEAALINPDEGIRGAKVDACNHRTKVMENMKLMNSRREGVKIQHPKKQEYTSCIS